MLVTDYRSNSSFFKTPIFVYFKEVNKEKCENQMISCTDIQDIINQFEKEKVDIELKSFRIFDLSSTKDQRNDFAYEIISLANRYGGKIILGINDDGHCDGKYSGNIDDLKGKIHNICHDLISPVIDCDTEFLRCTQGDFLIVYIPKRRSIPHAVVPNRKDKNVNSRIYYIRTSHGKKLVTDAQLEWLFKSQEDPIFTSDFRILIEFNKNMSVFGKHIPWGNYHINNWLSFLSADDTKRILEEENKFYQFFTEMFPFFILKTLADYYSQSWFIGIDEQFDRMSSGPKITKIPVKSLPVKISDISIEGMLVVDKLSWDFKKTIEQQLISKIIHVPPGTEVNIIYETESKVGKICFKNPAFSIEIGVGFLSSGAGLHPKNPFYQAWLDSDVFNAHEHARKNYLFFDGAGYTHAEFEFPEYDIENYDRYFHYYESLKKLFEYHWSFDKIMTELSPKRIFVLEHKLETIFQLLQNTKSED